MEDDKVRKVVREGYATIAKQESSSCAPANSCCEGIIAAQDVSKKIGYTDEDLQTVPEGSNLGLGCGNPVALASLREGETVIDLGAGAGFDCFLAARKVGEKGKVIGVDMTPEMIEKARKNAKKGNYTNVEFRLGEIENLPVADNSVDVIISNCVINLSPDKAKVFTEAFRVLKPGGKLMISDVVLLKELPDFIKNNVDAYVGCLSGAIKKDEYLQLIEKAGFQQINVIDDTHFPVELIVNNSTGKTIIEKLNIPSETIKESASSVVSIKVQGIKQD
ncbi:MAG: arsenite methyltransferase [Candidatus Bathyarchaeota archaeon]|nr:arsenite methyltransferase [Candidatus Bathyarchaeota archaeon]